jgi:small-conductance mechanosensitive channel
LFKYKSKSGNLEMLTPVKHFTGRLVRAKPPYTYGFRAPPRTSANACLFANYSQQRNEENPHPHPPNPPSGLFERLLLKTGITADGDLAKIMAQAANITVYGFLGVTFLGTVGVDTKPIIAAFGVTGFAAGFALKEIATNFLSGLLLVLNKPFRKGQYLRVINVAGLEGYVESIDVRYVILRTGSDSTGTIMIPASVVYSNPILVLSEAPTPIKK